MLTILPPFKPRILLGSLLNPSMILLHCSCDNACGKHLIKWNAKELSRGIYFVKVESGGIFKTQKAVLVK